MNSEGFNFGIRQNGCRVSDVELPPWCRGDARLFVLAHRAALETDMVREVLPYWIDLVFGFRQTGRPAVDAINVFHPAVSAELFSLFYTILVTDCDTLHYFCRTIITDFGRQILLMERKRFIT